MVDEAVAVRRDDLLRHPNAYRGRLVRLQAKYAETVPFTPANQHRYDAPAYSTLAWERGSLEAVAMISVDEPGKLRRGANVMLAGYFFKIRRDEARTADAGEASKQVVVPVIVGRGVVVEPTEPLSVGSGLAWTAMVVGIALLAGFWVVVRRWVRDQAGRRGGERQRDARPPSDEPVGPDDPDAQPIDLDALQAEAQQGATASAKAHWAITCGACGARCRAGARFCDQCGASLSLADGADGASAEAKEQGEHDERA